MNPRSQPRRRRGTSLLEVVSASILIGVIMVPSLDLLRQTQDANEQLEINHAMTTLGVSTLEEQLAAASRDFRAATINGDFRRHRLADVKFRARRSESLADGGMPGRLISVVVTIWHDRDDDGRRDADEPGFTFASKVVRDS